MTLLGLDTATAAAAVCVLGEDGAAAERSPAPGRLLEPPRHARELMPLVAEAMEEAGIGFGDLAAIAVGVGPGTFTGLRIGVATARALAAANDLPLRPVSSLAALAAGIGEEAAAERPAGAAPALSLALIDARRGELFGALHRGSERIWEPFVAAPEAVAERLAELPEPPLAAGDGALRFRDVLEAAGARVAPDGAQAHVVRALHVCRLAQAAPDVAPETVVPHYLRAPDAKPRPT